MTKLYSQFIRHGDLVFDIGAERGHRTAAFLELGAKVIAVEPVETRAQQLRERFGDTVTVVQKAIGSSEGTEELITGSGGRLPTLSSGWAEALKQRWTDEIWTETQSVTVTTLDKLIEQYGRPSFIKIDIEGYEYEALKGLSRPVGALSFEFTLGYMEPTWQCLLRLYDLGITVCNFTLKEEMTLQLPVWVEPFNLFRALENLPWEAHYGDIFAMSMAG